MSTLKVQLFGGFRIILNGQDIGNSFPERVRLLLVFILLNFEQPISRTQAAFTLWPDSSESQARTNLRNLLHHLRSALPDAEQYIEVGAQTIQLRKDVPIDLDVQTFKAAIAAAGDCPEAGDRIPYLRQAVDTYRGELLPDLYDDWVIKQREELRQEFVSALVQLGSLLEDNRQYQDAIQVMERLIRYDPLNESAYQQSMRIHALNNDRAGALKVYHACSTALRQELDVEPSPETLTCYQQILQQETPAKAGEPGRHLLDAKRMVGRQQEWESLRTAWRAAAQGEPGVILIVGEAGVGKTRLVSEMAQWTRRQGIITAFAQCYAGESEPPYSPIVSWLRTPEIKKEIPDLDAVWQDELARLLPEFETLAMVDSAPGGMDQDWRRRRLFEAMARGILGSRKPRLLVLEDAHWSDQDSSDFVQFLLRYDRTAPLLILLTARLEELTPENRLSQMKVLLQTRGNFREIELQSLKKDEVRELVGELTSQKMHEEIIDWLFAQSEGIPLFVVEMLRAGTGLISDLLPQSIRSLLTYRINQLSPFARDLVGTASAIGREFSYRLLKAASRLDEDVLVQSLDELWQRRIIHHQHGDRYNFTHAKLRDTVYYLLSDARRRLCHQCIADALASMSIGDSEYDEGLTAKHFELAGQVDQAVVYYTRAARTSRWVFANSKAIQYLEQALALASGESMRDDTRTRRLAEIRETLGDLHEITGKREEAAAIYSKAIEQSSGIDNLSAARIMGKIARVNAARFGYEDADEKFLQALDALGNPPDENNREWWREWLDIQFERVWVFYNLADIEGMKATLEPLLPVIERLNIPEKLIAYDLNLAALLFRRERYRLDESTLQLSRGALKRCQELKNSEYLIRATIGYGLASLWGGNLVDGKQQLTEGMELAERAGDVINQIISLTYLAVTNRLAGDVDACQSCASRALILCEREHEPTYAASARANLGWAAWRGGNSRQARVLSLKALENWSEYYPFRWLALWTLTGISLQESQLGQAVEYALQILDARQQALPEDVTTSLRDLAGLFQQGNTTQAGKRLQQVIGWAQENHYL